MGKKVKVEISAWETVRHCKTVEMELAHFEAYTHLVDMYKKCQLSNRELEIGLKEIADIYMDYSETKFGDEVEDIEFTLVG